MPPFCRPDRVTPRSHRLVIKLPPLDERIEVRVAEDVCDYIFFDNLVSFLFLHQQHEPLPFYHHARCFDVWAIPILASTWTRSYFYLVLCLVCIRAYNIRARTLLASSIMHTS